MAEKKEDNEFFFWGEFEGKSAPPRPNAFEKEQNERMRRLYQKYNGERAVRKAEKMIHVNHYADYTQKQLENTLGFVRGKYQITDEERQEQEYRVESKLFRTGLLGREREEIKTRWLKREDEDRLERWREVDRQIQEEEERKRAERREKRMKKYPHEPMKWR